MLAASALLALLNSEPGAEAVAEALPEAAISAVNLSEVVAKLVDAGLPEASIRDNLQALSLDVVPFDRQQAYEAGLLRSATKGRGLSMGDRGPAMARHQSPRCRSSRDWPRPLAMGCWCGAQ